MRIFRFFPLFALCLSGCWDAQPASQPNGNQEDANLVVLGKLLFNEQALSSNGQQACARCHNPNHFFVDNRDNPVSEGAILGRKGTRNAPSIMYAQYTPILSNRMEDGELLWFGGLFLDGRRHSLEEQAHDPFFNTNEMNNVDENGNPDVAGLIQRLQTSGAASLFQQIFGANSFDSGKESIALANIQKALAAFERSMSFNPFNSRFDRYLKGSEVLSNLEQEGLAIFVRSDKGNCAACHSLSRDNEAAMPLFTDFTYDNLGLPKADFLASDFVDEGLAKTVNDQNQRGKFKVPTLRNVAKTAPYMHNGIFKDLRTVVEFYNTRDTDMARWGLPEVPETMNKKELGNLKLSAYEIDSLVAFLNTLTDE